LGGGPTLATRLAVNFYVKALVHYLMNKQGLTGPSNAKSLQLLILLKAF
jgi:hypothetical protein